jgi:glutamate synthase (NADPH/NADH) large chain
LERIDSSEEEAEVKDLIRRHAELTGSDVAAGVLEDWEGFLRQCVKVMPTDYKRVLQQMKQQEQAATT